MMEHPEKSTQKPGRIFLGFAVVCLIAAVIIVLTGVLGGSASVQTEATKAVAGSFDHDSAAMYNSDRALWPEYREAGSQERTLEQYYALRQYIGSPPLISHEIDSSWEESDSCLSCHADGGWAEKFKRNTPITPHPLQTNCRQCHIRTDTDTVFQVNGWQSILPPRLGISALPGSPPLIAHGLQMRENCIACHVGPGAVAEIRVTHASRGNCRQCHVVKESNGLFRRDS